MSNVEVSTDQIKFPTWVFGVILAIFMSWMGWISVSLISTKEALVELRAQVRSQAVPEGTEKALAELRNRMNAELSGRDALAKLATENAKDISYLIREVETLKANAKKIQ